MSAEPTTRANLERMRMSPLLRRLFGEDFAAYSAAVSRWWPRLRGWQQRAVGR